MKTKQSMKNIPNHFKKLAPPADIRKLERLLLYLSAVIRCAHLAPVLLVLVAFVSDLHAADSPMNAKPAIVLVHGAFADGSGWSHVIPLLEEDGYLVTAVQNPLTSLADDVATTKRVIDAQKGDVVLVGHSYGGAVITAAATDSPKVKALVYIAAFAPDSGDSLGALLKSKAPSDIGPALVPDSAGFLYIDRAKFHDVFAKDVPASEARIMAAAQKPIFGAIFETLVPAPAWKTIPSWYLVATEDRAINPDLERFMAQRMGATTSEVKASHVPFITRPKETVKVIEAAARTAVK
jgi:pimeloyl-ACP methyl ester carboxylesterase